MQKLRYIPLLLTRKEKKEEEKALNGEQTMETQGGPTAMAQIFAFFFFSLFLLSRWWFDGDIVSKLIGGTRPKHECDTAIEAQMP